MSRSRPVLKPIFSAAVIVCVGYFVWRTFRKNWVSISALHVRLNFEFVAVSIAMMVGSALFSTIAWQRSVNGLTDRENRITFSQSVGTVNTSSLTKYVPGKIWSYALQMYWLSSLGFSKSLVLYVNLVNMGISLLSNVVLGLACWLLASNKLSAPMSFALLSLLVFDAACVLFSGQILNHAVKLANRLFKRNIAYFRISPGLMLELQACHMAGAVLSGFSMFVLCFGVGYPVDVRLGLLVTASSLIADVVGYLAFMVPGGIGVREGLMYAMLGGAAIGPIALVLPLAARAASMLSDVAIGLVALKLLQNWPRPETE